VYTKRNKREKLLLRKTTTSTPSSVDVILFTKKNRMLFTILRQDKCHNVRQLLNEFIIGIFLYWQLDSRTDSF